MPPVASGSSESSAPAPSAIDRSVFYDSSKPLTRAHYEARTHAEEDWQDRVKAVEAREKASAVLKNYIEIIFWKDVSHTTHHSTSLSN